MSLFCCFVFCLAEFEVEQKDGKIFISETTTWPDGESNLLHLVFPDYNHSVTTTVQKRGKERKENRELVQAESKKAMLHLLLILACGHS